MVHIISSEVSCYSVMYVEYWATCVCSRYVVQQVGDMQFSRQEIGSSVGRRQVVQFGFLTWRKTKPRSYENHIIIIIIIIIITIITIIIITISFMHGIYTYIPETNCVPREYSVAAILLLLFMVLISLVTVLNMLYFYISTFRLLLLLLLLLLLSL